MGSELHFDFWKMHGLGNCFVLVDDRDGAVSRRAGDWSHVARIVCNVHFGIGADGLVLIRSSKEADFEMVIFNADGSRAEMCGNAIRCVAALVLREGMTTRRELAIATLAGVMHTVVRDDGQVTVDMGAPAFSGPDFAGPVIDRAGPMVVTQVEGRPFAYVSMGNPHAVAFVEDHGFDWQKEGARVETATAVFPHRTNVEFVSVANRGEVTMKVWERGCGPTMACGTGACAVTVAGVHTGRLDPGETVVHLPGGDLRIAYTPGSPVQMTGPADLVCTGSWLGTIPPGDGVALH